MKPAILIVIIGLIIISGCMESKISEEEYIEKPIQEVTITTDKTKYNQGDIIKAVIRNNLNTSIWYIPDDCPTEPLNVYKFINNNWKQVHFATRALCRLIRHHIEIKPGTVKDISYEYWKGFFKPGKYKIGFEYGLIKPEGRKLIDKSVVYSNEFTIKVICITDPDCILTMYPEDSCCQVCKKEAVTKKEEGIRSSWREENCAEEDYRACPEEVECIMKEEEAKCVEGECVVIEKIGTTSYLSSKSCDELIDLQNKEYNKLDFSCKTDEDCVSSDAFFCSGCLNKNADIKMYEAVTNTLYNRDDCLIAYPACLVFVGCKCTNDKCESLFK